MTGRVHIIGAGLAGLSAAIDLLKAGRDVALYESAGHAGGRCRSFHDSALGRRIDNGNHLLLSGNRAVQSYLSDIGSGGSLSGPGKAEFPFIDLSTGERWTVALGAGFLFRALLTGNMPVPGSRRLDYLQAFRLAFAGENATVAQTLGPDNVLFRRFWEPLAVAVLNTEADRAAASLLRLVIRETMGQGEAACRPLIANKGLSESFVDPALGVLGGRGVNVRFNSRLRALQTGGARVSALDFGGEAVGLEAEDNVILAVSPNAAAGLVPGLEVPDESRAIVNGHFLLGDEDGGEGGAKQGQGQGMTFLGLLGGTAEWLFVRGDVASVTVSAADKLAEEAPGVIAGRLWTDVAAALGLGDVPLPPHKILKEKRATFAGTPAQIRRRAGTRTPWANLFLAGDWTDTGLPATIEGAVRSGRKASETILKSSS
jgi:squalene-associated FAD-dependent desaturase